MNLKKELENLTDDQINTTINELLDVFKNNNIECAHCIYNLLTTLRNGFIEALNKTDQANMPKICYKNSKNKLH